MSHRYTFIAGEHPDYGSFGWKPVWMDDGDYYGAMAVAHDILEHPPCRIAKDVEGEFMALGGALFVRGETGWFSNGWGNHDPLDNLAADFRDILTRVVRGEQSFRAPPRTTRLEDYTDDAVHEIVKRGLRTYRDEFPDHPENEDEQKDKYAADRYRPWIVGWMRLGYRYARNRYGAGGQYEASHMFTLIRNEVNRYLPPEYQDGRPDDRQPCRLPHGELFGGEKLHITPNFRRGRVTVRFEGLEDDY